MHYYKRNLGDYAKKAGRLSMLQHGSYTLLIDACYDREKFPTMEEAIEWAWASTPEEVQAVQFVLGKFFTLENGVYVQNRIKQELEEFHAKSAINTRIAIERETKRAENRTKRARVDHEPPPNQEPLTINQNKTIGNVTVAVLLADGCSEAHANELLSIRKKKRAPLTKLAWNGIKSEIKKAGMSLDDGIGTMSARGWQSFESAWVDSSKSQLSNVVPTQPRNCVVCKATASKQIGSYWYCPKHDQYSPMEAA